MDNIKDGGSDNRQLVFDDTNYDYWKAKMIAFLKSIYNKTWMVVIKGWKHHVITSQDRTSTLKSEVNLTNVEDDEALGNSKALNVIFNGMDNNMFRLINMCTKSKESWDILKTAYEGTFKIRI